ncbi:MAG: response regulator [Treponema sp.]|jgi:signal transduction histidine kinase/CheY-like chemotaxis protein|nr:response regulator [Treponema sp.]
MKDRLAAADHQEKQAELMSNFFIFSATMSRFIIFSVTFFFVIILASSIAFVFSMRQITGTNKGSELSQILEIERLRMEIFVNSDISVALKMADSPIIRRYFANPDNSELKVLAFEELEAYHRAFKANSVFWINDKDRIFYSDDYESYILDPENPDNYWYNMTLYETDVYNFNINYNPELNITNLWINAPVFDDRRNPIGIAGTGIEISEFINTVYREYTGRADIYFFNGEGEITGAKNVALVSSKKKINDELYDTGLNIIEYAKNLNPGETSTFDSPIGKIALGTLPLLEWYSIAILPDSIDDYNSTMTVLFFAMLMVVALVFVIFNVFIAGLLKPLRKSMEEAETSNRAKSAFLANMSHEIRTPMNSIVGFSDLALDGEASPKTRDYLAKIQTNAEWLLQIINDILDISKIESGKMELEHIPFDMQELFSSCRTLIMPKAIEKGIQLHFYVEPNMGKMPLGDPTRLRQVLVNLLSNAVKFTNAGIVKLQAVIDGKTEKTTVMHFEVEDSGIGMTAEQIEKIFDPFTQAETGTTRKYGGTGLGLAITKNIIEMMGGKLFVESTPKVGSKFSFNLTFDTLDVPENIRTNKANALDEIEKPVFEGEILLCEDNFMNQQVICEHLARIGLETVVADNGKIGVDMVRGRALSGEKQFDLIFMDMHMPIMDGLEASAKILKFNTGVPIIAMTANIMSNDLEVYKQSGMNDCVGKPFTSQELWRCLLKYLKPVSGGTVHRNAENVSSAADSLLEADEEFQKIIRKTFVETNQNIFDEILKALDMDDIKLAHRLAHSLKSNAGQIGIMSLQKAAADVEYQLKDGENLVTKEQMSLLETELNAVLAELKSKLDDTAGE